MSSLLFFIQKLSNYRRDLIIGILLSIALAASSIALLTLSGWFISAAAFAGLTASTVITFNYFIPASMIRLLAFIRILSRYGDRVVNHDTTFKILRTLRVWFYETLIPLAPAHLLSHRSGDLLNRITHDVDTLDHLYLNVLSPFCVALFLLILITLFVAHFTVSLALIIFVMLLLALILIPFIIFNRSQKIGSAIQNATAELRIQTIDFLQGFVDLLLFVKKEDRISAIENKTDQLISAQKKFARLKGFTISSMQLLSGTTVWLVLMIGIPLVRNQIINGPELAMIILLVIVTFEQLLSLPFAFLSLGKSKSAADRLLEIAHTKPTVVFSAAPATFHNTSIVFKNVSFSYPNRIISVLENINLDIPAGTHLGITGDSGTGKTTLMQLLTRIWDPASGEITVGDTNLKKLSEYQLRKTVSLVAQHVHIFNASVRDNITLMQTEFSDEQCYEALEKVDFANHIRALPDGLNTLMGEFGKNFSGGQIRRISIARALLQNTPILILDEPSTGLQNELMQRIWKNCESDFKNKTVIVITHDETLLAKMDFSFQPQ